MHRRRKAPPELTAKSSKPGWRPGMNICKISISPERAERETAIAAKEQRPLYPNVSNVAVIK